MTVYRPSQGGGYGVKMNIPGVEREFPRLTGQECRRPAGAPGSDPPVLLCRSTERMANPGWKRKRPFSCPAAPWQPVAILAPAGRGEEASVDSQSHIFYCEAGAPAMWAGVSLKAVEGLMGEKAEEILLGEKSGRKN